jgi:hypothetical protein
MRPGVGSLAGHDRSRVRHRHRLLPWPTRGPARASEGLDVFGEDGPDRSHLDSVKPLAGQHSPYVGPGGLELGGGFGYR